jgi:hypothetical protein
MTSSLFLRFAVLFGLAGMALGIFMAARHDFSFAPVHAHVNLLGWVGMFLAGLFYRNHPIGKTWPAKLHFVIASVGAMLLAYGLAALIVASPWGEPIAILGSLSTLLGMLVFAGIVFCGSRADA